MGASDQCARSCWGTCSCFVFHSPVVRGRNQAQRCLMEFGHFAAASLRTPKVRPWSAVACYRLDLAKLASPP